MAKKKSSNRKVTGSHHEKNAKAVLSLVILLVAFGILWVFSANSEEIVTSGSFNLFVILSSVGLAFLAGLLFLANPHHKK